MTYHLYDDKDLNKEVLMENEDFLMDAATFLGKREDYSSSDPEELYDRFMEHFRYQNVNEVTAVQDMFYAKDANDEDKAGMGRLMNTFDRMDSDLGFNAAQDYLGGVLLAPSTYAGMFSFGAGKAASIAANTGTKLGIRHILKGAGRSALGSAAVDVPFAAANIYAQEQTRVDTGQQEEIDYTNVGFGAAISTVASGTLGGLTGAKRAKTTYAAESIKQVAIKKEKITIENAHAKFTKPTINSKKKSTYNTKSTLGKDAKSLASKMFLSLDETIPEKLKEGQKLKKRLNTDGRFDPTTEKKLIENIAAAGARIINEIPPIGKMTAKGVKKERITSRLARGITEGYVNNATIQKIMKEHDITTSQLGALFAEELSSSGAKLGRIGRLSAAEQKEALKNLTEIDLALQSLGDFTGGMRTKVNKELSGIKPVESAGAAIMSLNKARIGFMTTQFATTAKNVSNGYMRNFMYGFDNFGAGLANMAIGTGQGIAGLANKDLAASAKQSIMLGSAQMRTGFQAAYMKDLWFGTTSVETQALDFLFTDPRFGKSDLAKELFRDLGDIAEETDATSGFMWLARKANYLNTMSDNMFKRAIFSREIDKALRAKGQGGLSDFFKTYYRGPDSGLSSQGKFSQIDDDIISDAMEEALAFTFQTGKFKGKKGGFNSLAQGIIDVSSTGKIGLVVSQGVPFPRYLINQFIFQYEHMPILGMFDLLDGALAKSEGKAARTPATQVFAERFGKQVGGLATLSAFFGMRTQLGDESTGPYQYNDPFTGKPINAEANLGPFMGFAMLADLIYRLSGPNRKPLPFGVGELLGLKDGKLPQLHDNGKVAVDIPYTTKEIATAFTGGMGRAGVGLDLMNSLAEASVGFEEGSISEQSFQETMAKTIGNFFNTFTVGAGMLKDIAGTFLGDEYRIVQDNTDVDMMEYTFKQAARSIPQAFNPEEGDIALTSPTLSGPVRNVNPFSKLVLGITYDEEKSDVKKELDRLKFDYFELSPTKIKLDAPASNEARGLMGKFMNREIASFFSSPDYQSVNNDVLKRELLKKRINDKRKEARERVLNIEEGLSDTENAQQWKTKWNALGSNKHRLINAMFRQMYSGDDLFSLISNSTDPATEAYYYQVGNSIYDTHLRTRELQK